MIRWWNLRIQKIDFSSSDIFWPRETVKRMLISTSKRGNMFWQKLKIFHVFIDLSKSLGILDLSVFVHVFILLRMLRSWMGENNNIHSIDLMEFVPYSVDQSTSSIGRWVVLMWTAYHLHIMWWHKSNIYAAKWLFHFFHGDHCLC